MEIAPLYHHPVCPLRLVLSPLVSCNAPGTSFGRHGAGRLAGGGDLGETDRQVAPRPVQGGLALHAGRLPAAAARLRGRRALLHAGRARQPRVGHLRGGVSDLRQLRADFLFILVEFKTCQTICNVVLHYLTVTFMCFGMC